MPEYLRNILSIAALFVGVVAAITIVLGIADLVLKDPEDRSKKR